MDNEAGGHRIQRVPPTERRGRVHTSTATVAVINPAQPTVLESNGDDFHVSWFSGSGSGGQHRNKHQNSCRITHLPTGLSRKAETRSRESSYRGAMIALRAALEAASGRKQHSEINAIRQSHVGSGMRGDKRRTYRFQDDSVVDHVSRQMSRCSRIMRGYFDELWPL